MLKWIIIATAAGAWLRLRRCQVGGLAFRCSNVHDLLGPIRKGHLDVVNGETACQPEVGSELYRRSNLIEPNGFRVGLGQGTV